MPFVAQHTGKRTPDGQGVLCSRCALIFPKGQFAGHRCGRPPRAPSRLPIISQPLPCVHRGEQVSTVGCGSCGDPLTPILSCAVHEECCIGKSVAGVRSCRGCHDRATVVAEPFKPTKLAVVTTHFNPARYKRPRASYDRMAAGIAAAGVPLFTVELAFDGDPFTIDDMVGCCGSKVIQLRGTRARNTMWQKERMIKIGVGQVPDWCDAIAWIDGDVLFPIDDWPRMVLDALQRFEAVQLYDDIYNIRGGTIEHVGASMMRKYREGVLKSTSGLDGCPGLAWAARAQPGGWLRTRGLRDDVIVGSGDVFQCWAFTGLRPWETSLPPRWHAEMTAWAAELNSVIKGAVTSLPLSALHLYHGSARNRDYAGRWQRMLKNGFDPATDLQTDAAGLWAWTDSAIANKPALVQQLKDMFPARREDD